MKITQDVRDYAREHGLETSEALEAGMHEQAEQFHRLGGEIYHKA
jgi:phosphomethylpyrimidine synthase